MSRWKGHLWTSNIGFEQVFKRFSGYPVSRLMRVDVDKEAKDTVSICGTSRKGINVEKIISGLKFNLASFLLARTKAGIIDFPGWDIGRK